MAYQKIIVVGNLGGNPDMRYLPNGQPVTNFTLATNRQYTTSGGEKVKETTWFRISVFGRQAETSNEYLSMGSKVLIEGRLSPDKETGGPRVYKRQDGTHGSSYELVADRVVFMDSKGEGHKAAEEFAGEAGGYMEESDLPF